MLVNAPEYSNWAYWDNIVEQYIRGKHPFVLIPNIEQQLWEYFKYCLRSRNRYFFQHPLIPVIKASFEKNTYTLKKGTEMFRARNDDQHAIWNENLRYAEILSTPKHLHSLKNMGYDSTKLEELQANYVEVLSSPETEHFKEKLHRGFQGYDADGCGAPPSDKASAGRCNSEGVAYLYAAQEEHTAVAEIRPYVGDTISIATIQPKRDLMLVNLDYDPSATVSGAEFFYNEIQQEFARVNRGEKRDYLITQYITSLVEHSGYDGLCFRSSLVKDGTNYLIFQPTDCTAVSSKICYLNGVQYQYFQFRP